MDAPPLLPQAGVASLRNQTMRSSSHIRIGFSLVMTLLVAAGAATVARAESSPVEQEHKGGDLAARTGGGSIVIKRGDTLDKIITRHLSALPIKADLIRQEIIKQNPAAFKGGKASAMVMGASLQLPGMDYFRDRYFQPNQPSIGAGESSMQNGDSAQNENSPESIDPRKGWVRFP